MINFLSNWIEGIAIAAIIASIFEMIIPNGNIKKYIKVVLGIYVIFSIIAPFVDSKALYSINTSAEIEKYEKQAEQNFSYKNNTQELNNIYTYTFEKELKQTIEKRGYNVYNCKVEGIFDADKKDAGIKKIKIVLESTKFSNNEDSTNDENKANSENEENNIKDNDISINAVEKIQINVGENVSTEKSGKITDKDIKDLKKYLSKHYEVEQKIIDIQKR